MPGPAGRLDAVLVCGGRWHDFDYARLQLLAGLADHERVRTRVFEDYACLDALERADLLVTYTCALVPDPEQRAALVRFVARGGRWLALHGTNAAIEPVAGGDGVRYRTPRAFGELAPVLGSQFLGHPPITPYTVTPAEPDHPFLQGIPPFQVTDELYVSELHPPLRVLAHTRFTGESTGFAEGHTSSGEPHPVLYLRAHQAGTVCYFTLGHCRGRYDVQDLGIDDLGRVDRGSWDVPEYRTILRRCLHWAVTGRAEAGAPPGPAGQ